MTWKVCSPFLISWHEIIWNVWLQFNQFFIFIGSKLLLWEVSTALRHVFNGIIRNPIFKCFLINDILIKKLSNLVFNLILLCIEMYNLSIFFRAFLFFILLLNLSPQIGCRYRRISISTLNYISISILSSS